MDQTVFPFSPVAPESPWLVALKNTTDWLALLYGIDLKQRREQVAAAKASAEVLRRMRLQSEVAGCRKTRSERWNHAHFLRWIEYHAAAFDVVYGKLTAGISVAQARSFVRNFHYVEYSLAKRRRILMENWGVHYREKLCKLLQSNDHYFSLVRRFHKLHRGQRRAFMNELDAVFSVTATTT